MDRRGCHGRRGGGVVLDEVLIGYYPMEKEVAAVPSALTGDGVSSGVCTKATMQILID